MTQPSKAQPLELGGLIRKCRKQRGLTLQTLCDRAGVSVGYLSQVERGNSTPSLATLAQIAQALDLGLDYFVTRPKAGDAVSYADRRRRFSISDDGMTYETISAEFPAHELSSYIMHCPPGYQSEVFQHEGEELVYILSGCVEKTLAGETFVLNEGDSLHFNGMTAHSWKTLGEVPARMLWTGTLVVLQGPNTNRLPSRNT